MALPDAYASSNGWSGGSPLTNTGALLGNYLQGNQVVNPTTNTLTTATPTTVNTQPSSLSRVVNPSSNAAYTTGEPSSSSSGTSAATSNPNTTDTATIASQAAANAGAQVGAQMGAQISAQHAAQTNPNPTLWLNNPFHIVNGVATGADAAPKPHPNASISGAALGTPTWMGPQEITVDDDNGIGWDLNYNPSTNKYEFPSGYYSVLVGTGQMTLAQAQQLQAQGDAAAATYNAQQAPALNAFATQKATWQQNQQTAQAAIQTQADQSTQQAQANAAQLAADQASAFNLNTKLQAPNTTDQDTADANSLAQVQSQYNSGLGGADSGYLGYLGQGAQQQQIATNQVNHDTAYANAFDQNYGTFANALQAQQTAQTNVTGQQMALDVQGISQALSTLQNQASQLGTAAQTNLNTQLLPLTKALQQYQQAVTQYGQSSSAATSLWKAVTSLAGTAFSAAVK